MNKMQNKASYRFHQLKAALQTLNSLRMGNLYHLVTSYILSRIRRTPFVAAMPYAISIEPSGLCNLACPECPTGAAVLTRPTGMLDFQSFQAIIDSFLPTLMHVNLFFQGEPLMNRHLGNMIAYASEKKIYTLLSTNGQLMNEKRAKEMVDGRLTEIIFSMDGVTQKTYETYRVGGKLSKLTAGVELLVAEKRRRRAKYPLITIQFIAFEHNQHEIPQLKSITRQLGADRYVIKTAQFNDFGDGSVRPPTKKRWQRYDESTNFNTTHHSHCWRQWSSAVVGWDGTLTPCCFDKNGDHALGNVLKNKTIEIWKGQKADDFRKQLLTNRESIDICKNCPEGRGWL